MRGASKTWGVSINQRFSRGMAFSVKSEVVVRLRVSVTRRAREAAWWVLAVEMTARMSAWDVRGRAASWMAMSSLSREAAVRPAATERWRSVPPSTRVTGLVKVFSSRSDMRSGGATRMISVTAGQCRKISRVWARMGFPARGAASLSKPMRLLLPAATMMAVHFTAYFLGVKPGGSQSFSMGFMVSERGFFCTTMPLGPRGVPL